MGVEVSIFAFVGRLEKSVSLHMTLLCTVSKYHVKRVIFTLLLGCKFQPRCSNIPVSGQVHILAVSTHDLKK
jgi:hypothetical protein